MDRRYSEDGAVGAARRRLLARQQSRRGRTGAVAAGGFCGNVFGAAGRFDGDGAALSVGGCNVLDLRGRQVFH
jgi:hypothetical protein